MNSKYDLFGDALLSLVKSWRSALDDRFRPFGLSQARWQVLLRLLRASEPLTQCDLAQRVGIEPASLVRLLDALQQEGLIVRAADPQDRRTKRISLTPSGLSLSRSLGEVADQLREEVLGSLSDSELSQCTGVLEQLKARLACLIEDGAE
jgi:MarR family transcriptional regulator for hemolysin